MTPTWVRAAASVAVAGAIFALSACGDDGGSTQTAASSSAAATDDDDTSGGAEASDTDDDGGADDGSADDGGAAAGGQCAFLGDAAVSEGYGTEMSATKGTAEGCTFESADGEGRLMLTVTPIEIDEDTYASESRTVCEDGSIIEVSVGDGSFACLSAPDKSIGMAFANGNVYTLDPSILNDIDVSTEQLAAMMEKMTL